MKTKFKNLMTVGCCFVCLLVGSAAFSESPATYADRDNSYVPGIDYKGEFIPSRLYYHNPRSAVWRRMSASDNYRDVVKCKAALVALEATGSWQGHLNQDGSCGSLDEPSYFALGSRINYDISLDKDISSK